MNKSHPYIPRLQEAKLKALFQHFPAVVVSGARQVGKSTILMQVFGEDTPRVVFDPSLDIENARQDPDLFLQSRPTPVILDEIQYAPELVSAIKRRLEKDRSPGQYLITGSEQWGVIKLLSESLAGRAAFLDLEGFALAELAYGQSDRLWLKHWLERGEQGLAQFKPLSLPKALLAQLWTGSMPEAQFLPEELLADFFMSYVRTYVERDIRQLVELADLQQFSRFFKLCAAITAQELNYSKLGREIGINPQTASRWLQLLKSTFQWTEVPAFSGNIIKRVSGKPKGYFTDTGLACWAQAISTPTALLSHPLWGALFETFIVAEIRKQSRFIGGTLNLYHWRTHSGAELDLLIEWNGRHYPIEIKGKSHPDRADARGIRAFRENYPHLNIATGLIMSAAETSYPVSQEAVVLPWNMG